MPISKSKKQSIVFQKWTSVLAQDYLICILIFLAVLLTIPSIYAGLQIDDYHQKAQLTGAQFEPIDDASLFGLFSFCNGDVNRNKVFMDTGLLPWWTYEALRISFFRPISEITHYLDYWFWPETPELMHLHSIVWYCALIILIWLLYRRMIGVTWIAGLAALFFTLDHTHGVPVGWLASRSTLIAGFFGIATIIIHDKWRKGFLPVGAVLGPFCFLIGLLSAEHALAAGAYLLSYTLFIDPQPLAKRWRGFFPYVFVGFCWLVLYRKFGFGTQGSGMFFDPVTEPLLFLKALLHRPPVFFHGQLGILPAQLISFLPSPISKLVWYGTICFLGLIAFVLVPILRQNPVARFWGLGMLCSLIPICATAPDNRYLLFVGLGAHGLLSLFIGHWFERVNWFPEKALWRFPATLLVYFFMLNQLVLSPIRLPFETISLATFFNSIIDKPARTLPIDPHENENAYEIPFGKGHESIKKILKKSQSQMTHQDIVLVNPPSAFLAKFIHVVRIEKGLPVPPHFRILTSGDVPLAITRTEVDTLEIDPQGGFMGNYMDQIYRGNGYPMEKDQLVELSGMTVQVLSLTPDGRPQKAAFRFSVPLENKSLKFLQWKTDSYTPFTIPRIGETVCLPAEKLFKLR